MAAGSKIKDDKQEYGLSQMGPSYVSPSGHELSFYDTEENERLVVKHASGSHIEFKADGSVFIKAMKDLHWHSSPLSDQAGSFDGSVDGADQTSIRQDTDMAFDVGGRLTIKAKQLDIEVDSTTYFKSGTDFKVEANNIMHKSAEQGSYEATKSLYFDSKEKRERFTSTRSEVGTEEGAVAEGGEFAPKGGLNVINVHGNTVIENSDPSGGITLSSAGYLNLVCGGERVDIIGKWGPASTGKAATFKPGLLAKPLKATYSTMVFEPTSNDKKGQQNAPPGTGGSWVQMLEGSMVQNLAIKGPKAPLALGNGHLMNVTMGNKTENVLIGNRLRNVSLNETVTIGGIQTIKAKEIYLN